MVKYKEKPVTERIKTFEDAVRELGDNNSLVNNYRTISNNNIEIGLLAYLKLRIVVAALNEGWKPVFAEEEERWYSMFSIWGKEILETMSKELIERDHNHLSCYSSSSASSFGLSYLRSYPVLFSTYHYSETSAHLALKSEELADYCGKQFIDLWTDFILPRNE